MRWQSIRLKLRLSASEGVSSCGSMSSSETTPLKPTLFVKFHEMVYKTFREILSNSVAAEREGKWETRSVFQGGYAAVFFSLHGSDRDPSLDNG